MALTFLSWTVAAQRPNTLKKVAQRDAAFGLRLFQEVLREHKHKNLGFSPYGATAALNILQSGADGETLEEFRTALNYGYSGKPMGHFFLVNLTVYNRLSQTF